jgi:hypothetical protein
MVQYICCFTIFVSMVYVAGLNAEAKTETSLANLKCSKEELMSFFPQRIVESILIKAKISKEQASVIADELSKKDHELTKFVEEKAAQLNSNSHNNLSQRDLAIKIYRETLYEVFAKVLKAHGVTDEDQIQSLLDQMQEAKSKLFIECIRKQQQISSPSPLPSSS